MSYDLELIDPTAGNVVELEQRHHLRGGTYAVGGTTEAAFNITYNYSKYFYDTLGEKGIRTIYGMTGAESIPVLTAAADQLEGEAADNYWEATSGNAKCALLALIELAKLAPHGVWDGD